jgi:hypothetical protein
MVKNEDDIIIITDRLNPICFVTFVNPTLNLIFPNYIRPIELCKVIQFLRRVL